MLRCMPFVEGDLFYKSLPGSVRAGQPLVLKLLLPPDGYVKGAVAVLTVTAPGSSVLSCCRTAILPKTAFTPAAAP